MARPDQGPYRAASSGTTRATAPTAPVLVNSSPDWKPPRLVPSPRAVATITSPPKPATFEKAEWPPSAATSSKLLGMPAGWLAERISLLLGWWWSIPTWSRNSVETAVRTTLQFSCGVSAALTSVKTLAVNVPTPAARPRAADAKRLAPASDRAPRRRPTGAAQAPGGKGWG